MVVKEELNFKDFKEALLFLKSKIQLGGEIKLYLEINEFEGGELLQEIGFKLQEKIEKIAIVCTNESIENLRKTASKFYRSDIKFFELLESKQAKKWIHLKA